jgi:transcriptional regulator GlxA family with amidase domain
MSALTNSRAAKSTTRRRRTALSRLVHAGAGVTLGAIVVAAALTAGTQTTTRELFTAPPAEPAAGWPEVHAPADRGDVVVAVVLGQTGTVASDVLAPYEVFASSGAFTVYTVAENSSSVPLTGGTSLLPTFTFDDVDAGRAARPDVVVVPAVEEPAGATERDLRAWIVARAAEGARMLGVCSGSEVLAATGLLDGHQATSHWSGLASLRARHPDVDWVSGKRWVHDRGITTTAGISSGIPGALEVVRDLAGAAEATRLGRALAYSGWELGGSTQIPEQHFTVSDVLTVGLNAALPWLRPTVAIGLTEGVGEIDTAAVLEAYSTSGAARTLAVAATPAITTRHGLMLTAVPTRSAPAGIARVVVPGPPRMDAEEALRAWSTDHDIRIESVSNTTGTPGFEAALEHIARHSGSVTARSVAKMIDYPTDRLALDGREDPRAFAFAACVLVSAVAVGHLPSALRRARRVPGHRT